MKSFKKLTIALALIIASSSACNNAYAENGSFKTPLSPDLIAFSRQRALNNKFEVIANNIANANTSGFKSDIAVFSKQNTKINGLPNPIPTMQMATDVEQGNLKATNRQLDVAIQGKGYFQIQTPLGARYTRSGSFFVGSDGALVDKNGNPVVGDGGPISIQPTDTQLKIGDNGQILSITQNGSESRGAIGVFKFSDPSKLQKVGNTYFKSDEAATAAPVLDYKVAQGMIEESNVNSIAETTRMLEVSRDVASTAKIISNQNDLLKNSIARISAIK